MISPLLLARAGALLIAAGLLIWSWPGPWLVMAIPAVAAFAFMLRGSGRSLVVAGTVALPYAAYAMSEIIVTQPAPNGALICLAGALLLFSTLMPALRSVTQNTAPDGQDSSSAD